MKCESSFEWTRVGSDRRERCGRPRMETHVRPMPALALRTNRFEVESRFSVNNSSQKDRDGLFAWILPTILAPKSTTGDSGLEKANARIRELRREAR
jgi:hypothetical protein